MSRLARAARSAEMRNVTWLLGEYGLRIGLVFVATALVARHLGPEQFGTFALLYTLITLILPFTDAGLNHLVSREIVAEVRPLETILGTAAGLRLVFCILGIPLLVGLAVAAGDGYPQLVTFAALAGVLNAVTSLAVLDYYFQSALRARMSVIARTSALAIISVTQILLILADAGLTPFLVTLVLQQPLFGIFYYVIHRFDGGAPLRRWTFERRYARSLFSRSGRLTAANIADAISLRSPVILLAQFGTPTQVGILGAATRPIDMVTVLSNAAGATLLPRFVRTHQESARAFERLLRTATAVFTGGGVLLAAAFIASAPLLVKLLYGDEFEDAARVMQLYAPALVSLYFRGVMSKWLITEERFNLSLYSQGLSAVVALVGSFGVLRTTATADVAALVLVGQAFAATFVALATTRAGRAYLGVVLLGRPRPSPCEPTPRPTASVNR